MTVIEKNYFAEETEEFNDYNRAVDGIESLALALASQGYDTSTDQFKEAVETAVEGCANNL